MTMTQSVGGTHQQSTVTNRFFFSFFGYRNFSKIQQNSEQKNSIEFTFKNQTFPNFSQFLCKKNGEILSPKKNW
jgi:hypothetical protein